ncbi:hypothetical protein GIB67_034176, partial [Kingdonia uniflora]
DLDTAVTTGGAITGFSQLFEYLFYEYYGVGHPIVKEEVIFLAYPHLRAWERGNRRKTNDQATNLFILGRYHIDHKTIETITWRPWLESAVSELDDVWTASLLSCKKMPLQVPNGNWEERDTYSSYWANQTGEVGHLLTDSQRMGNIDLFRPSALMAGITPVVVTSASVHSLSQDFSLPGDPEGPDPGLHIEWTERHELPPIHQSARDAQRFLELTHENATLRRHLDSVDDQLYAHDLHMRRGRDVRVVPLPPGGGAKMRQRRSGP